MTTKQLATAKDAPKDLRGMLSLPSVKSRFENILGRKSQAFISSIISVTRGSKALQECDPSSIIAGAAMAASLDLPIVGSLGQSCIVPYSGKAQFQIMARGFVQLAIRSGQYKTMNSAIIHKGEITSYNRITGEISFSPEGKKSDKVVGFLFYFKLVSGYEHYTYMTVEECQAHGKKYSKSYGSDSSKWKTDFNAMSLKTVVKQGLSKWGPLSTEMQKAIEVDQAAITEEGKPEYIDSTTVDNAPAEPISMPVESAEPETIPPATTGTDSFPVAASFLFKVKAGIEMRGPDKDQVYLISPEEAKAAKANFKAGDMAELSWEIRNGARWITELNRKAGF